MGKNQHVVIPDSLRHSTPKLLLLQGLVKFHGTNSPSYSFMDGMAVSENVILMAMIHSHPKVNFCLYGCAREM